jgi:hypothetical protein
MPISIVVLECPFCNEILEAESPDRLHSAYSFRKPLASSYHGDVVKKKYRCQNPECRKSITIYWYAPLDYFNRI